MVLILNTLFSHQVMKADIQFTKYNIVYTPLCSKIIYFPLDVENTAKVKLYEVCNY